MSNISAIQDQFNELKERIQRLEHELDHLKIQQSVPTYIQKMHQELGRALGKEAEKQGLTEEQLLADIKRTRKQVFQSIYGDIGP